MITRVLLLLLAAFTAAFAFDPNSGIDDRETEELITEQGAALIKAGTTVKMERLRAQLERRNRIPLTLAPPGNDVLSPEQIHAKRRGGVLIVGSLQWCDTCKKHELSGSTGFAITADAIVINHHVINNSEAVAAVVMDEMGKVFAIAEVLAADPLSDVALVRVADAALQPLPLAPERPAVGAPIWVISHPDHNFWTFTHGMVSRHVWMHTDLGPTPQLAVTADFGVGSSGGPLLDAQGNVAGMVCSTTSVYFTGEKKENDDLQMVLKHCVPVSAIRALLTVL